MSEANAEVEVSQEQSGIEPGVIWTATVQEIGEERVTVALGEGAVGFLEARELRAPGGGWSAQPGDEVEVLVDDLEGGAWAVSVEKAQKLRVFANLEAMAKEEAIVTGVATRLVRQGLSVDIGVRALLLANESGMRRQEAEEAIGSALRCQVIRFDAERGEVILSRKSLAEAEAKEARAALFARLAVGQRLTGRVSSLASYGAFIDLGGADGLLHVSEIRWERTNRPEDALAVGEEFEVEVIELDESRDRISLSRRSLVENPWEVFARNHPEGSRAQGVVSSLTDFGAFVSIDGVDGLIHISELSWDRGVREAAEVLSVGQEVEALVLRIEPERQRVGLSLKRLGANPWEVALSDLNVGEHRKGRVRNVASFGVFVEILPGVEGLVHVSDMSWTKRVDKPSDFHKFEADEEIEVAVLEIDAERQRLKLGIKQLDSDPWELAGPELRDGGTLTVTISRLAPFGAFATIAEGLEGLIHISEISTERVERVEDAVKVGQERKVRVLSADRDKRKISLSIKAYSDEDADALREYAEAAPAGSSALAEQLIAKGLVSPAPEPAEAAPVEAEAAPVEAEAAPAEAEAAPAEAAPAEAEAAPAEAEAAPEGVDPEVAQQS